MASEISDELKKDFLVAFESYQNLEEFIKKYPSEYESLFMFDNEILKGILKEPTHEAIQSFSINVSFSYNAGASSSVCHQTRCLSIKKTQDEANALVKEFLLALSDDIKNINKILMLTNEESVLNIKTISITPNTIKIYNYTP